MSKPHTRLPSGILRRLLARLQPVAVAPATSLAFMMLAPTSALAQTAPDADTTLATITVEDTADPM